MPLVDMHDLLNHAYRNNYAVGGFNLVSLDFLDAVIAAAEHCRSPVILGLADAHFDFYDFELLMTAMERAARRAAVPVALHLNHGCSCESIVRAINLGCNGVLVDCSSKSLADNVRQTRQAVEIAHGCGVTVEGELGYVAAGEGDDAASHPGESVYTSVAEARAYAERTGIDCLAVSIGTAYGRLRGRKRLDFDRLKRINAAVGLPLVIHGGSGLTEDQYHRLIYCGVAKINYHTALSDVASKCIRDNVRADAKSGYAGLMNGVREQIRAEVERVMHLWGSTGRAAEVLMQCRPWQPVQQVMMFNIEFGSAAQAEDLMVQGNEVLTRIPGVRRVISGWAVSKQPRYRYCWLVELAHEKVIDTFRNHPEYAAFANRMFLPVAGERISIEFAEAGIPPRNRAVDTLRLVQG